MIINFYEARGLVSYYGTVAGLHRFMFGKDHPKLRKTKRSVRSKIRKQKEKV